MKGELFKNKVIVSDNPSISKLYGKRSYGSIQDKRLHLSILEAYYLFRNGKLEIYDGDTLLDEGRIDALVESEKDFNEKYAVYKDLRDRAYIVKTGFKYGSHFRVYRNSIEEHAEYLVCSYIEHGTIDTNELIKQARLAHSVKKKLVIALVDEENDITYYSVGRMKI